MPLETFIIPIYGHLCTALEVVVPGGNPRSRGFPPKLSDAEALTMEFVGAFLGYHGDQAIGEDWRRHGATGFPHLGDRSTFVRQLANLGQIKALLHQHWAGTLGAFEAPVHLVDGFPVPVCHPKRVSRHTVFRGEADWGFCASKDQYDFGFHAMLLTTAEGVIAGVTPTAARIDERDSVFDLPLERIRGALLGDQGFIRPVLTGGSVRNGDRAPYAFARPPEGLASEIVRGANRLSAPPYRNGHRTTGRTLFRGTSRCAKTLAVGFSHLQGRWPRIPWAS